MKTFLINLIVKCLPQSIIFNIEKPLREKSKLLQGTYSQNGEDILLQRLINNKREGFFVDIGAHHPIRFSNTYKLYQRGWRGINIDAMPGSMTEFQKVRPLDINLEIGVSDEAGNSKFYIFNEPALNTFSSEEAERKDNVANYKIIEVKTVTTHPLRDILRQHLPEGTAIDYLNIDVEGLDLKVLSSNDWDKYQPAIISVEYNELTTNVKDSELYRYLSGKGYDLISVLFNTLFFVRRESTVVKAIRI
jgi:FkbM family methyltransferase